MTEASFEPPDHPSPLILAALARDEISESEKEAYTRHLARCHRCMATYAEFVAQALQESNTSVPPAWIDEGLRVPASARSGTDGRSSTRPWKWALVGAGGVLVIALAIVLFNRNAPLSALPGSLQPTLSAGLRADSQGSLVYRDDLPPEPRGVRGNNEGLKPSVIDPLLELYRSRPNEPEVAFWVVSAYLAANQVRNADPFLREARERFPEDPRFLNLAAILAYKLNKLDEAEAQLRQAIEKDRNATALVNLAMVRRQEGDEAEAETLLNEAITRFPDSPLSPYIRELTTSPR